VRTRVCAAIVAVVGMAGLVEPAWALWRYGGWSHRKMIQITALSRKDPLAAAINDALATGFTIPQKKRFGGEIDAAMLKVPTDGLVEPGGADIRLTTIGGRPVPHRVVYCDQPRHVLLVYKVDDPNQKLFLYYHKPTARPEKTDWVCRRGLFMETRRSPGGMPGSLDEMKRMWQASPEVYGVQYNLWVFNHYNPMGPIDRYLKKYEGWLHCPETGMYEFGTTSDSPSFFLIDGKLVIEKTGPGRASREITHKVRQRMTQGTYPVTYYGGGPRGPYRVAACWKLPSAPKIDVIRYEYFPKLYTAEVLRTERKGSPVACDFTQKLLDSMPLAGGQINSYQFTNRTAAAHGTRGKVKYVWEFGDGTSSTEPNPRHVFFKVGDYRMRLTATAANGRSDTIERVVRVEDFNTVDHERQHAIGALMKGALHLEHHHSAFYLQIPPDEVTKLGRQYLKLVRAYDKKKVTDVALWGLLRLYRRMRERAEALACASTYLSRFGDAQADRAAVCYLLIAADLLYEKRDLAAARQFYSRALSVRGVGNAYRLVTHLRLGEMALLEGKLDESRRQFSRAHGYRQTQVRQKAVLMGLAAYEMQVRRLLSDGQAERACGVLARWEREYPSDMMRARCYVLRGQAHLVGKAYARAFDDLRKAVTANPHLSDLPHAYYLMGRCRMLLKDYRGAQPWFRKVTTEFTASPWHGKSLKGLNDTKRALGEM